MQPQEVMQEAERVFLEEKEAEEEVRRNATEMR